jgi:hypothetical protein
MPIQQFVPKLSHAGDTKNFDEYPETDIYSVPSASEAEIEPFHDF